MEEENKRILEFAKEQQNREEERMEKRKQAEEAMTKVQQRVRFNAAGVGVLPVGTFWCMWFSDKSINDVLQHLPANHEQELCRVHSITYARMTIV